MVRGINSFNPANKMNGFLLKGNAKSIGKASELPAKIAIGTLGACGIANSIKESGLTDTFVVNRNSCDDYEPVDYCTPLFP